MVEIGKVYFFKTVAHFYVGKVVAFYPTHATIESASEVYETGPLADFYEGKVKACERVPDGTMVPLSGTMIAPWPHRLPSKAVGV